MTAADRLIVAFDAPDLREAVRLAKELRGLVRYAKIGSILFTAAGPAAIERFRMLGFEVFLDLKFHDIPSTVEQSCRAAVRHRVSLLTIHASGQPQMLEAAAAGARQEAKRLGVQKPRVIGVTVLTSVSGGTSNRSSVTPRVVELALQAQRAGLDGVVASAHEASAIRRKLGKAFLIVCPGIRPSESGASDQRRIATPRDAMTRGADLLVVGRPITEAGEPRAVVTRMLREIAEGRAS
ncbi:MAG: orotidine-5'-phosphate decarboxylase [Candidatus Omnitrophica bacterium]|nr:orotidine-5'-phosphate decarboxylase [Candidatus Omnitrophota bacterium]